MRPTIVIAVAAVVLAAAGASCSSPRAAENRSALAADTASTAPLPTNPESHETHAGMDHTCPDAGQYVDGEWQCDVAHAVLHSRLTFDQAPTAEEEVAAAAFAARVRAAAEPFEDVNAARRAGYTFDDRKEHLASLRGTGLYRAEERALRRGAIVHLVNQALANDTNSSDPDLPDALVYATNGDDYALLGVMFLAPPGDRGDQVGGPLTTWHTHHEGDVLCWSGSAPVAFARLLPGDSRYHPTGGCPAGQPVAETPRMLHVWFGMPTLAMTFASDMSVDDAVAALPAGPRSPGARPVPD